jgi:hypothetical protein
MNIHDAFTVNQLFETGIMVLVFSIFGIAILGAIFKDNTPR